MKCPNCNYVSHDYLDVCPSCRSDWSVFKAEVGLYARPPGIVPDLSEAAAPSSRPADSEIVMAPPAEDAGASDAIPSLEFLEIEDEPSGDTSP